MPPANQYTWWIGDGMSTTLSAPTPVMHLYAAAGTYTAMLEVCQTGGGCDTFSDQVEVLPAPVAGFDYAADGLMVTFTNTSEYADDYLWAFGDGITSTLEHPVHLYDEAGAYTATLWAYGCGVDEYVAVLTVEECEPIEIITVTAEISGCVVIFGTEFAGSEPYTWLWDFGAFGTSLEPNPEVNFEASGTYPYTLTAENACGDDIWVGEVTVECEPPCAEVEIISYTATIMGCVVDFGLVVTGDPPFTYLWHFGDGMTSTLAMPTHTYTQTGTYNVTAHVYNCVEGHDMVTFAVMVNCDVPPVYKLYLPIVARP